MKKFIVIVIAAIMTFALSVPVFANTELGLEEELPNDEEESPKEEELPKDETEKDENDEIFGRPLTDEEKQAIEDYFNSMQENGNS